MTPAASALFAATTRGPASEPEAIAEDGQRLGFGTDGSSLARSLRLYHQLHRESAMKQLNAAFPRSCQAMGEGVFSEVAERYLLAHPYLRPQPLEIRSLFARFLASAEVEDLLSRRAHAWLTDLVRLEEARLLVDEARADMGLRFKDLKRVPPERWADLPLCWQTSVQRLDAHHPLDGLWGKKPPAAAGEGSEVTAPSRPPAVTLAGVGRSMPRIHHILVWRDGYQVMQRELAGEEARLFDELELGGSLSTLCARVSARGRLREPEAARTAVQLVQRWSNDGCLNAARRRTSLPAGSG